MSLYDLLDEYQGESHASLLEHFAVRQLFYWEAIKYPSDEWQDLCQRAYILFLEAAQIQPAENYKFSRYLMVVVRHAVSKAFKYRHRKKRHLPTVNFSLNKETQKFIEPKGVHAEVLFHPDDVSEFHSTIRMQFKDESRQKVLMTVLDGLLNDDGMKVIARRAGISSHQAYRAKTTLRRAFSRCNK